MASHPDFQAEWCQKIISDPEIKWIAEVPRTYQNNTVSNSMFQHTLYTERGIKAHLSFYRPCKEPDAFLGVENCFLLSLGDGLDGKAGRCHGGFNSLVLDQVTGSCAHHSKPDMIPPATATMTVDFKFPISTPCVVIARAWMIEITGRKMWVKGVIEDKDGNVCATAKSLFVRAKELPTKL
jgi:acyl-coenzyme A thioesterase PaaI-like protein